MEPETQTAPEPKPAPLPPEAITGPALCSSQVDHLLAALAKAQGAFAPIVRSREVTVRSDKGNYTFEYAPLETVLEAIRPALAANGLSITHPTRTGVVRTVLGHASGQWLASEEKAPSPLEVGPQKYGSYITYMRRYHVSALTGVASEADDDGNAAEGNHIAARKDKPQPAPQAAPKAPASPAKAPAAAPAAKPQAVSSHGQDRAEASGTIETPPAEKPAPAVASVPSAATDELFQLVCDLLKTTDRTKVREWVSWTVGRQIKGPKDLTMDEVKRCCQRAMTERCHE